MSRRETSGSMFFSLEGRYSQAGSWRLGGPVGTFVPGGYENRRFLASLKYANASSFACPIPFSKNHKFFGSVGRGTIANDFHGPWASMTAQTEAGEVRKDTVNKRDNDGPRRFLEATLASLAIEPWILRLFGKLAALQSRHPDALILSEMRRTT